MEFLDVAPLDYREAYLGGKAFDIVNVTEWDEIFSEPDMGRGEGSQNWNTVREKPQIYVVDVRPAEIG